MTSGKLNQVLESPDLLEVLEDVSSVLQRVSLVLTGWVVQAAS